LSIQGIRDYCLQNLNGVKLSIEEAIAIILHMVSNAFASGDKAHKGTRGDKNAIALDIWHKELKLIALGVHSQLSPIELEFDLHRKATPAKDKMRNLLASNANGSPSGAAAAAPSKHVINDPFFDQYDLSYNADRSESKSFSPPKAPAVDEFEHELLINSFKQVNSSVKAQYMGILTPLGQEPHPPANAQLDAALKNRMNRDVIIPIPEALKYVGCVTMCQRLQFIIICVCMYGLQITFLCGIC